MNFSHFIIVLLIVAAVGYAHLAGRPYSAPRRPWYLGTMMSTACAFWVVQLFFNPIISYGRSLDVVIPMLVWWVSLAIYVFVRLWPPLVWHFTPVLALGAVVVGRALSPYNDWKEYSDSSAELVQLLALGLFAGSVASFPSALLYLMSRKSRKTQSNREQSGSSNRGQSAFRR